MKKLLRPIFAIIALFSFGSMHAQAIPNGGFENWTPDSYEELDYYQTSNFTNILRGFPANVLKVADPQQGNFAVQMNTVTNGTDTSFGYFINGNPEDLSGGIPYSQHPVSLTGYYKSNIPAGDTGFILVVFKEAGVAVSVDVIQFYGVHNTYTAFTLTLNIPSLANPDTVLFGAASSNAFVSQGIPGSMLQLDNLVFTGVSIQPTNFNGSFESWSQRTEYLPNDWEVSGDTVFRTTNAYSGTYSLRLGNAWYGGSNINPGVATTGYLGNNGPAGGRPYTLLADTLTGYYKFTPTGNDSATVWVSCTNNMSSVGGAYVFLPPAANWTYFSIPFGSMIAPDTLQVTFGAVYNTFDSTNSGSVLYVDNVSLKSSPLSTGFEWNRFGLVTIFPNPAADISWIEFCPAETGAVRISVLDENGKIVFEDQLNVSGPQRYQLDLGSYALGLYLVNLEQNGSRLSRRLIKK